MTVYIKAPAKINLHLDIAPPEKNDFHPLRSVFVMVSLFDEIWAEIKEPDSFEIQGFEDIAPQDNILYRTWRKAVELEYFPYGISIKVFKRIPIGAGLGGGSSDCAALIKLMALLHSGFPQDVITQHKLAADMGSDVPFFLGNPLAYVQGRGEILRPIKNPSWGGRFLLIKPDFSISTAHAFKWLDKYRLNKAEYDFALTEEEIIKALNSQADIWPFFNSFHDVLIIKYPIIKSKIECLKQLGAKKVIISGSGSSIWAFFSSNCENIAEEYLMQGKKDKLYWVNPLDTTPIAVVI
ncbi:MAG: 4-(cytidine 5'-diphospho)-2-C-methyl-D-erythritol kinase [Spirochaetaceae bacterium]|nr:4-(cytidine 5'-diphospho)-2-C-methyl-D-erythritol kinase [Spirochaetaceae bacterium]